MASNPLPQRKSPRLQGYDYTQSGLYFVTICTHQREQLFGEIDARAMHLNMAGEIAYARWQAIPEHHPNVELDLFVVMPNHIHGILILTDVGTMPALSAVPKYPSRLKPGLLGTIIGSYKSGATRRIREHLQSPYLTIWQGRYHDHIIRSENSLNTIREYVQSNPARWQEDKFYSVS